MRGGEPGGATHRHPAAAVIDAIQIINITAKCRYNLFPIKVIRHFYLKVFILHTKNLSWV